MLADGERLAPPGPRGGTKGFPGITSHGRPQGTGTEEGKHRDKGLGGNSGW